MTCYLQHRGHPDDSRQRQAANGVHHVHQTHEPLSSTQELPHPVKPRMLSQVLTSRESLIGSGLPGPYAASPRSASCTSRARDAVGGIPARYSASARQNIQCACLAEHRQRLQVAPVRAFTCRPAARRPCRIDTLPRPRSNPRSEATETPSAWVAHPEAPRPPRRPVPPSPAVP